MTKERFSSELSRVAKKKLLPPVLRVARRVLAPSHVSAWEQEMRDQLVAGRKGKSLVLEMPGFTPRNDMVHFAMEPASRFLAPDIWLFNRENVDHMRNSLSAGKRIMVMLNHLSNADAVIFDQVLRRQGYEDLADKCIYMKGIKLNNDPATELFSQALPTILTWPDSVVTKTPDEARECERINKEATAAIRKVLGEGYIIVLFPEGGRSEKKELKKPVTKVGGYLSMVDEIQPVGIWGTERILPTIRDKEEEQGKVRKKEMFSPNIAKVSFGKALDARSTRRSFSGVRDDRREAIMDFIMRGIAKCLPPRYHGVYK